jgi:hypothetical protein
MGTREDVGKDIGVSAGTVVVTDVGMAVKMNTVCFQGIQQLALGERIDETPIHKLCLYVDQRHDCADFRLIVLVKTLLCYEELLAPATVERIRKTILSFKYWMDEPGDDGMCYWSENHQLLFSVCEYFAGSLFPDEVFTNNQQTGLAHAQKAKLRILRWLEHRAVYGFIEWHSNTYYEEDVAPLCVLIDHAGDETLAGKATMILDLMMLDFAHHCFQGRFVASSGRCYETQKKDSGKADVNDILDHAFGAESRGSDCSPGDIPAFSPDYTRLSALFLICRKYQVPQAILNVYREKGPLLVRESSGLDLSEVAKEFPRKDIDEYGMYLWAMEAFTNRESIETTIDIFNSWKLQKNTFLKDLGMINIPVLRNLRLLPLLVRILNPATQGVAIQRANVQSYKTPDYLLSSVQRYHPGEFGDQQHIWQATLPGQVNVFSTHPAAPMFDDPARNFSPSWWVGNGINPDCAQDRNLLFLVYDTTPRKGFLERTRQHLVHFYIPVTKFDEVIRTERAWYGRVGSTYVGILSSHPHVVKDDELQVPAQKSGHVVILGSARESGSFEAFRAGHHESMLSFNGRTLRYKDPAYLLHCRGTFLKDQCPVETEYPRLDSPFVTVQRKGLVYDINFEPSRRSASRNSASRNSASRLVLDFCKGTRSVKEGGHEQPDV